MLSSATECERERLAEKQASLDLASHGIKQLPTRKCAEHRLSTACVTLKTEVVLRYMCIYIYIHPFERFPCTDRLPQARSEKSQKASKQTTQSDIVYLP